LTTAATTAAVFPGQGSQTVGMLADIAPAHPQVGDTFAEAASVLGIDLWTLSQSGPAEALADTRVTQPLMFTADIALWRISAARTDGHTVEAVNFNAPGQVALSGHLDAVEAACELARERGARRAMLLPVSVPNHSSLMRDAGAELEAAIDAAQWQEPQCSIVQNAQASAPASLEALVTSLKSHVFSPVRWTASIEALRDSHGVTRLVECGPGKVLTGLSRRIDKQLPCLPTDTAEGLDAALEVLSTQQTAGSEA